MRFLYMATVVAVLSFHAGYGQISKKMSVAIDDSIQQLMKKRMIPGLSLTVAVNGNIVYSKGYGFADLEQQVKVDPKTTKFRIGSISKSFTAAGLARLYEQGKIVLDSSIYFYLPDYPRGKYRPTVRQIAGHIGGIRHYKGLEFLISTRYPSVTQALDIFKNDSLVSRPGTAYQYSSYGFNLLSAVMEKASHKDFLVLMNEEVFSPLGLKNTMADMNDSIIHFRTRFYLCDGKRWTNAPYVDNSYKWAGGGFISSSEDIARFACALLRDNYLQHETVRLFRTHQRLSNGTATSYGIGFSTKKDDQGIEFFGHRGGSVGGTSDMVIYPDANVVVVVLTNLSGARLGDISNHIAQLFIKQGK